MASPPWRIQQALSRVAEVGLRSLAWLGGEVGSLVAERLVRQVPHSWLPTSPRLVRRNGVIFVLDVRDNPERTLFYTGFYDRALHRFLLAEAAPGDTFVDVGAHIGLYALPVARKLQRAGSGTVIAFEPASDSVAMLRRLVRMNHLDGVVVAPVALGAAPERRPFRASVHHGAADTATRTLYGGGNPAELVDVRPFDDWTEEHPLERLDVLKIDVEGGELGVLAGMGQTIRRFAPRCIVVEVQASLLAQAGVTPDALESLVADLGYCPDGPSIADVAGGRHGHLGANVVLRPCGQAERFANRNRSPVLYIAVLKAINATRSLRDRIRSSTQEERR